MKNGDNATQRGIDIVDSQKNEPAGYSDYIVIVLELECTRQRSTTSIYTCYVGKSGSVGSEGRIIEFRYSFT